MHEALDVLASDGGYPKWAKEGFDVTGDAAPIEGESA
jgi:hypothetical protein